MRRLVLAGILFLYHTLVWSQPFDSLLVTIDSLLEREDYKAVSPLLIEAGRKVEQPSDRWRLAGRKQFAQWIAATQAGGDTAQQLLIQAIQSVQASTKPDPDFTSILYTQHYHYQAYKGNWAKSLAIALELQAKLEKNPPTKQKRTIDLVYDIGYIHDKLGNVQSSIENYERSLALYETASKPYEHDRALAHNNLASKYSLIERFDKTIYHYTKAVEWWTKADLTDKSYLVSAYNNLIYHLLEYGDHATAKKWVEALNKGYYQWKNDIGFGTQNTLGKQDVTIKNRALQLLANIRYHTAITEPTFAQHYFDSLQATYLKCPPALRNPINNHYLTAYYLLGGMYEKLKNTQAANQYFEAGLAQAENLQDPTNVMLMQSGIANLMNASGQYATALQYTNASLDYFKHQKKFNVSKYSLLILKAMSLQNMGRHAEAVNFTDNLLAGLYQQFNKGPFHVDSLAIGSLAQINSRAVLRITLNAAMIYRKAATALPATKASNTTKSLHLYHLAADMFQLYYQKSSYTPVLDQFQKEVTDGLLHAITAQQEQNFNAVNKALSAIVNNGNQHLWRQFEVKYASRLAIPEPLIEQHRQLRAALYLLQHPGVGSAPAGLNLQQVLSELSTCEAAINKYDRFYLQQSTHSFDIAGVRKLLSDQQCILRYFVTDSSVYGVFINRDALLVKKLGSSAALQKDVTQYRYQINTIYPNYQLLASSLYQSLIRPFAQQIQQKRLLIVPDRWLEMLPFEALYNQKTANFLVQEHAVGYAGSLPLWELAKQMKHPNPMALKLAVFAPEYLPDNGNENYNLRTGTAPLAFAIAEANSIASAYQSRLFAKADATKANFIATANNYRIMHFAMHATMDSLYYDSSALIFSNKEEVPFAELYQMELPLDLAVLSACNTGMGKYKPGEGLFGLSRAFTYAGTKSTVHSLWQVPDKETAAIITQLYASLMKGYTKDIALQKAKLAFLQLASPPEKHPYYWAGFAVSGSMEPIDQKPRPWLLIPLSAALIGIGFLGWRHYKVRHSLLSKADA